MGDYKNFGFAGLKKSCSRNNSVSKIFAGRVFENFWYVQRGYNFFAELFCLKRRAKKSH